MSTDKVLDGLIADIRAMPDEQRLARADLLKRQHEANPCTDVFMGHGECAGCADNGRTISVLLRENGLEPIRHPVPGEYSMDDLMSHSFKERQRAVSMDYAAYLRTYSPDQFEAMVERLQQMVIDDELPVLNKEK